MSAVNGPISRSETLSRAQDWVNRGVPYSQSAYTSGPNGEGSYRQDCSGMVSMAWHLDRSENTSTLPGRSTPIAVSAVRPGDALAKPGHVVLVATTPSNGRVDIYQEREPGYVAQRINMPLTNYTNAYRYNNITDDTPPAPDRTPIGCVDEWRVAAGEVFVSGWALSRNTTDPIKVEVLVDGVSKMTVVANGRRDDLVAGFGVGPDHGFGFGFSVPPGVHQIALRAVNDQAAPPLFTSLGVKDLNFGTLAELQHYINALAMDLLFRANNIASIDTATINAYTSRGKAAWVDAYLCSQEHGNGVIRAVYKTFLGRAPSASELALHWPTLSGAGETAWTVSVAASDEAWAYAGGTAAKWVALLYRALLGREGSAQEAASWVNAIASVGRSSVATGFMQSTEYGNKVTRDYFNKYLQRPADANNLAHGSGEVVAGRANGLIRMLVQSEEYWVKASNR